MACGCKKKKKKQVPVEEVESFMMTRAIGVETGTTTVVRARCTNCPGLLRTWGGKYLPMHTGEYYEVTSQDVSNWRSQGWAIEVKA